MSRRRRAAARGCVPLHGVAVITGAQHDMLDLQAYQGCAVVAQPKLRITQPSPGEAFSWPVACRLASPPAASSQDLAR